MLQHMARSECFSLYSLLLQYGACCLFNFPIDNWPLPPSHHQTDSDTPSVCNDETATDFGTVLCVALGCAQWASIIRLLLLFRNTCQNLYIRFRFYLLEVTKRSDWYLFFLLLSVQFVLHLSPTGMSPISGDAYYRNSVPAVCMLNLFSLMLCVVSGVCSIMTRTHKQCNRFSSCGTLCW